MLFNVLPGLLATTSDRSKPLQRNAWTCLQIYEDKGVWATVGLRSTYLLHCYTIQATCLLLYRSSIFLHGVCLWYWSITMMVWFSFTNIQRERVEGRRERRGGERYRKKETDDFFMSAAYSADVDTATAVKHWHDVNMTLYWSFSGLFLQEKKKCARLWISRWGAAGSQCCSHVLFTPPVWTRCNFICHVSSQIYILSAKFNQKSWTLAKKKKISLLSS